MLKGEPFFAMARPSFFVEFLFQPFRITGRCLTFFPICRRSSAKTISGVYSKNPMPFFQLIPQRQCCKPINCCFIFRPQFGQTLLLAPISHRRVSVLCNEGRITGAQRAGSRWIIPENAEKPADARIRSGKYIKKPTEERGK